MLARITAARKQYPRQFWLLFWGMMISTTGSSMIWPFLMIYVTEKLNLPLTVVATLMTYNSAAGLVASLLAGPVVDRAGRKWVMVISLVVNGFGYLLMAWANSLLAFALLQILNGAFNPLYRVGADAMMADLVEPDRRVEAYSLLRMGNNAGISIGPAVGGFIAATSYDMAFYFAAAGLVFFGLLVAFFAAETLPRSTETRPSERSGLKGYLIIFKDRPFTAFTLTFTITQMGISILWVLLSVYVKHEYGIPENLYGWLPTTNAILVVALQMLVTRRVRNLRPLAVMAAGSLIYALSVGGVGLMQGFWGFWGMMVFMTIGEMMLVPTSTTYAANQAPADMRGRYMSIYGLTWPVAAGIGPVLGGYLSDQYGPRSTWFGGFAVGMLAVIGFLLLMRHNSVPGKSVTKTA